MISIFEWNQTFRRLTVQRCTMSSLAAGVLLFSFTTLMLSGCWKSSPPGADPVSAGHNGTGTESASVPANTAADKDEETAAGDDTDSPTDTDRLGDTAEGTDDEAPGEPDRCGVASAEWLCPTFWAETFVCVSSVASCMEAGGIVPELYLCGDDEGGGICCDHRPVEEGLFPCPEDAPGVSCELFWECRPEGGTRLFNEYYCSGDNTVCCESAPADEPPDR